MKINEPISNQTFNQVDFQPNLYTKNEAVPVYLVANFFPSGVGSENAIRFLGINVP